MWSNGGSYMRKPSKIERIGLFLIVFTLSLICSVPHPVYGEECNTPQFDYSVCLEEVRVGNLTLNDCACCVVSKPGGDLSQLTLNAEQCDLSECSKPIGILIYQGGTILTDYNGNHPIRYSQPVISDCDCCNVGVLVKGNPARPTGSDINDVTLANLTVEGWANGLLFWRMNNPGSITNSNIVNNKNGVYLFNARMNTIASNNISYNTGYGIYLDNQGQLQTYGNQIFNNIFNNENNVSFLDPRVNSWNITKTAGINILNEFGGNEVGGNYWAMPSGDGFSQKCDCNIDGFCNQSYIINLTGPNIDSLPLCKPLFFDVSPSSITGWTLEPGPNTHVGFTITLRSNTNVLISVSSSNSEGKLQSAEGYLLSEPLKMGTSPNWETIDGWSEITSNYLQYFDLYQDIVSSVDRPASGYSISYVFTITQVE
jgi:parallel beta-helix repeat protein